MEIYNLYQMGSLIFSAFSNDYGLIFTCAIDFGLVSWLALFVLQGVGLFVMGKRREMKNKWLAFVPFVNIYYMGKLAGECGFFGHKMKNAGLYAMIAQMLGTLFTCTYILAECYLYLKHCALCQLLIGRGLRDFLLLYRSFTITADLFFPFSAWLRSFCCLW